MDAELDVLLAAGAVLVEEELLLPEEADVVPEDAPEEELHVKQWQPYEKYDQIPPVVALQKILGYLDRNGLEALHSSTQIIIAPGYQYKIVKAMVTNFHQPQSTLLLLVSAFVKGNWRTIYDYALAHDFRFLSYGDSSLLIP